MRPSSCKILMLLSVFILSSCSLFVSEPLRVGVAASYPPVIFKSNGELRGIEVDFAHALAEELGRPVEFVELPFREMISSLQEDKIDIIMSGMSITINRSFVVNFLPAYLDVNQMFLIRKGELDQFGKIGSEGFLRPKHKVGVLEETTGADFISSSFGENAVTSFSDRGEVFKALAKKEIDCFVDDSPLAKYTAQQDASVLAIEWGGASEGLAWAVRAEQIKFHRKIWSIYMKWKKNGTIEKIVAKWLNEK